MAGEEKGGEKTGPTGGGAARGRARLTLSVDTATETRSVAVLLGAETLSLVSSALRTGGASDVLSEIDRSLSEAGARLGDIELLAVASGPGSFTGLRAGIATMKAFSSTLGKPLVGVPTLHAIAHAAMPAASLVALIPAGRGEVFGQFLGVAADGLVAEREGPYHLPPERLIQRAVARGGGIKWAGDGALKFKELIAEAAASAGIKISEGANHADVPREGEWLFAPRAEVLAAHVGLLARSKFDGAAHESSDEVRAIYVRPSDAEINEQCREQV